MCSAQVVELLQIDLYLIVITIVLSCVLYIVVVFLELANI